MTISVIAPPATRRTSRASALSVSAPGLAQVVGDRRLAVGEREHAAELAEALGVAEAAARPRSRRSCRGRRTGPARAASRSAGPRASAPSARARRRPRRPPCSARRSARSRGARRRAAHSLRRCRQVLLQPRPRALQRAVDRRLGRLEQLGGVPRAPAEHVAQDQHGARARRQVLDRDHERELDRLARDDLGVGLVVGRDRSSSSSGIRLQPRHLAVVGRRARALARARPGRRWSRSGTARRAATPAPRRSRADRQARRNVSCVRSSDSSKRAEHPVAVDLQLAAVALDGAPKARLVDHCGAVMSV